MMTPFGEKNQSRKTSRRKFLGHSALMLAGTGSFGFPQAVAELKRQRKLIVIAYNVYKCNGWPKDNKWAAKARSEGQVPARVARELALYQPDIINFSEAPEESVVRDIAERLNMTYVFFESMGNWPGALLTKNKIEASVNLPIQGKRPAELFTRHWGKATVAISGRTSLIIHSVHLFPHDTPESRAIREQEISEILRTATADLRNGNSVIIMGDLNHAPGTPEYNMWIEAGWVDTFSKAGSGNCLTIRSDNPSRRIDYVLAKGPVSKKILQARSLFEGNFGIKPDDPESFALSDHLPHMAVFAVP